MIQMTDGYLKQSGGTDGGTNSIVILKNPIDMRVSGHL